MVRKTQNSINITINGREDTILLGHAQYEQMKAELDLLRTLSEAQEDMDTGNVAPIKDTFSDIWNLLSARKT